MRLNPGKYGLVNYSYVPLSESFGTCCDNCGKLIANIATIKNDISQTFTVGLDCAKTILGKTDYQTAKEGIYEKKRCLEKIKQLESQEKPYVLNDAGWPCFPPETRSGYMIKY